MNPRDFEARRCASGLRGAGPAALLGVLILFGACGVASAAQPIIWDDDQDGIDDRMETVQLLGYRFSFEDADTTLRQRFEVTVTGGGLVFGVYVVFDQTPTPSDLLALTLLGMPIRHRFEGVPAVRSIATMIQAQAAVLTLPAVDHIEVVPLAYSVGSEDAASIGARDPSQRVFPNWAADGGSDGSGQVIAILDSGINDAPEPGWPGHESLLGRVIGGAQFIYGDSLLDTPRNGSMNPSDHGGAATGAHATHVAGLALGTGGESGFAAGIAPGARAVDVKVINDAGIGAGIPEALDWCIHNRSRDWGAGGAYQGIDVINLSLSSLDESDGNDLAARLAARAAQLGIVVVASMGNDAHDHHVPSPASGDGVLAIGAYDAQRTGRADDDQWAPFNNFGPRASDSDTDFADEQKPDLLAPGVAVLSADGNLATDGAQYVRKSGTSMSAAVVSGAVAALRSEFPGLSPGQIAAALRATARKSLAGQPVGVGGSDPLYYSTRGWGTIDLYAARLEILAPNHSQVRRVVFTPTENALTTTIWTMRERGALHYVLERAPDVSGAPGTFAALDSVVAAGDSSLADDNLQEYPLTRGVTGPERGQTFWYRVSYTEGGGRFDGPARLVTLPVGPSAARLEFRIIHNAYDHDLSGGIVVGDALAMAGSGPLPTGTSSPTLELPGTSAAIASDWVSGVSTLGNVAWDFAIDIPADFAPGAMPPTPQNPWRLRLTDDGYLNRGGRIQSFRLIWHASSADFVYEGGPLPVQTLEGGTIETQVPAPLTGVATLRSTSALRAGPNPVRAGRAVTWLGSALLDADLSVFDVCGRQVATIPAGSLGSDRRWEARDRLGRPLPAGLYLARAGRETARLVVLSP